MKTEEQSLTSTAPSQKIITPNKELIGVKKSEPQKEVTNEKDKLPQPTGWRILVAPYQGKEVTDKGVIIPDQIRQREALATVVAYVLKVGPLAYKDEGKFGNPDNPWCKEGDWICIGRYAGSRFSLEDMEVRVINDDEVIATLLDPEDIKHI